MQMLVLSYQSGLFILVLTQFALFSLQNQNLSSNDTQVFYDLIGRMETAFYIDNMKETDFFFPMRLMHKNLVEVCINLIYVQSQVLCIGLPTQRFTFQGSLEGTVLVNWQMRYAYNNSDFSNKDHITKEEIYYNVIGINNRPNFSLEMELKSPPYGSIIASKDLYISYQLNTQNLPPATLMDSSHVSFQLGKLTIKVPLSNTELSSETEMEPGSYFFQLTPFIDVPGVNGTIEHHSEYPCLGYIEFVTPSGEIERNRRYSTRSTNTCLGIGSLTRSCIEQSKEIKGNIHGEQQIDSFKSVYIKESKPIRVCIWGNLEMDGQKNIFLQQLEYMDKEEFQFTWVVADLEKAEGVKRQGVNERLQKMPHVKVVPSPFMFHTVEKDDIDGDPYWDTTVEANDVNIYQYSSQRLKLARNDIDQVTPPWVKKIYVTMRNHIQEEECNIIVFGNSRGFSSNSLIIDTARILGMFFYYTMRIILWFNLIVIDPTL
jgi:hypothetical protein